MLLTMSVNRVSDSVCDTCGEGGTRLRNYQILTLIGSILGMIIAMGFLLTMVGLTSFTEPFEESEFASEETRRQIQENRESMNFVYGSVAVVMAVEVIAIILVFVMIKPGKQTKTLGIILIVFSIIVLVSTSFYGILPFALLLPAGILALRFKSKQPEPEPTYTSSGAISKNEDL